MAEKFEQLGDPRVARGRGDRAMEGEVLPDGATALANGSFDGAQGLPDRQEPLDAPSSDRIPNPRLCDLRNRFSDFRAARNRI